MNEIQERAEKLKEQAGGYWKEHAEHPCEDWRYEVVNDDTKEGYWMWCAARVIQKEEDDAREDPLQEQVDLFNKYSSNIMLAEEVSEEYYYLYIGGTFLSKDDYNNMYDKIRQINRENGYLDLERSE